VTEIDEPGGTSLATILSRCRGPLLSAALFSFIVNLLMLTGPLFMLLVYDRVMTSRSKETLLALILLVVFLYAVLTALDLARARIMARVAARVQSGLDEPLFRSAITGRTEAERQAAAGRLSDLEAVQRALAGPVALAAMDLPWVPLFLAAIFLLHPHLGWLALSGGGLLVGLAAAQQRFAGDVAASASAMARAADLLAGRFSGDADTVRALGMTGAAAGRWTDLRTRALRASVTVADRAAAANALSRGLRLFLQSAMLGLGAWLALDGQVSAGALAASSVLMGRALAPVEGLIGGWAIAGRALSGSRRLSVARAGVPRALTKLPRPRAHVEATHLVLSPPCAEAPVLRVAPFTIGPGQMLGLIGPSGAGKSTLLRAIAGVIQPRSGTIRLDGAPTGQSGEGLAPSIGYLPQRPVLFEGTVADNIARLEPTADATTVVEAAKAAGAHHMILALSSGYDTPCGALHAPLSGGQAQRISLARALYGDPVLLLLDEPDAGLDAEGLTALIAALRRHRAAGGAAVLATHRRSLVGECDLLLALEGGASRAFGPRDDVLAALARRHPPLRAVSGQEGAA
jgi:ATP-binding cassette, subfamily C, bacterial